MYLNKEQYFSYCCSDSDNAVGFVGFVALLFGLVCQNIGIYVGVYIKHVS